MTRLDPEEVPVLDVLRAAREDAERKPEKWKYKELRLKVKKPRSIKE